MKLRKKNCFIAVISIVSISTISFLAIDNVFLKSNSNEYEDKVLKEEPSKENEILSMKEEIENKETIEVKPKEEIINDEEVVVDNNDEVSIPKSNNKVENIQKKPIKVAEKKVDDAVVEEKKDEIKEVVNIEKISYSKNLIKMVVGETMEIIPIISPSNATNRELEYSTNNSNMLNVSQDGKVTALKTSLDPAYIYIKSKDNPEVSFMIKVYVFDDIKIQSLSFPKSVDTVDIATNGIVYKLRVNAPSASADYSNYTYTGIWMEYTSSNPDVARVQPSNFDTLYLNKPGTTIITARYRDGKTAQMELNVINSKDDQRTTDEKLKYVVDENEKGLE